MTVDKPINVHGSAVVLGTTGVLIRGESGSGKSRLARQLIEHYLQVDRYASWVADDQVWVSPHNSALIARVPPTIAGQAERRFCGIDTVPFEYAARIDLVVDLVPANELERLPDGNTIQPIDNSPFLPIINVPKNDCVLAADIILGQLQKLPDQNL